MVKNCRGCNSKNLLGIISLGNLYLSDFSSTNEKPQKYPLKLVLCKKCTLLQLEYTVPPSKLYTEHYGYKSGINKTMKDELKDVAGKTLSKLGVIKEKLTIVDIGANDGTLLKFYPKKHLRIGVEPIEKFATEAKKHADIIINGFFDLDEYIKTVGSKKADIVSAISCFYDMDNPNKFLSDVKKILHRKGVFVVQQNYLVKMLAQNAFDNVVHEHLEYYSLLSFMNTLKKHKLKVFDLELRELNGGSFRTYVCHKNQYPISNTVYEQMELEKMIGLDRTIIYEEFAQRIKKHKKDVYSFVENEAKKGKKIYVYGASTRGNTLLQYFNLDNKLINKAVERNPEKWGKKIASVGIPIVSEEQGRKEKPDYMLVLPWFFKDEFLKREKKYLESGGHFIFPLPRFTII